MGNTASVTQLPVSGHAVQVDAVHAVETGTDFDSRWDGWVARGLAHEQHAQRRFLIWCPVVAIGSAIAFARFRS